MKVFNRLNIITADYAKEVAETIFNHDLKPLFEKTTGLRLSL